MNREELRALAEDADPGPWKHEDYWEDEDGAICHQIVSGPADQFRVAWAAQEWNAAYIAAANPAAVLALLDALDAAEAERDALAARLARVEALPVGPESGGYFMVSMRDLRAALDADPATDGGQR